MPQVKTELSKAEMILFKELMDEYGMTSNYSMLKSLVVEAITKRDGKKHDGKTRLEERDQADNQGRNEQADSTTDNADPPFL